MRWRELWKKEQQQQQQQEQQQQQQQQQAARVHALAAHCATLNRPFSGKCERQTRFTFIPLGPDPLFGELLQF